jgi:small subunit ribosomal protein S16
MQRIGRTNMPAYRIIVAEHTVGPKSGKIVEKVGSYNPKTKVRILDADRVKYWISVGAKPSDSVHNMLITDGIIKGTKINVLPKNKNRKAEAVAPATIEAAAA